jgi:hypothetical protein
MYIAVILENFSQAQEDVQQVNRYKKDKEFLIFFLMNIVLGFNR